MGGRENREGGRRGEEGGGGGRKGRGRRDDTILQTCVCEYLCPVLLLIQLGLDTVIYALQLLLCLSQLLHLCHTHQKAFIMTPPFFFALHRPGKLGPPSLSLTA